MPLTRPLQRFLSLLFLIGVVSHPAVAQSDSWVQMAEAQLASLRTYPRSAQVRGESGTTVLSVKVDGNGLIMGYQVARSSGSDILDREAERVLDKLGQFEAPADRKPRTATLRITWPASAAKTASR